MIRHPSFEGLRLDKPADEVVRRRAGGAGRAELARRPPRRASRRAAAEARRCTAAGAPRRAGRAGAGVAAWPSATRSACSIPTLASPSWKWRATTSRSRLAAAHIARRPLTLVRCPGAAPWQCFFQKHLAAHVPDGVLGCRSAKPGATAIYPAVESAAGRARAGADGRLSSTYGGAHQTVEYPTRWSSTSTRTPSCPSAAPSRARGPARPAGAPRPAELREDQGGKGLHVVVPLRADAVVGRGQGLLARPRRSHGRAEPQRYLATMSQSKRAGKVFIDYLRNGRGATFVAPYSTRRRPGAPVSAPLRWEELHGRPAARRVHRGQRRSPSGGSQRRPLAGLRRDRPGDQRRHAARRGHGPAARDERGLERGRHGVARPPPDEREMTTSRGGG